MKLVEHYDNIGWKVHELAWILMKLSLYFCEVILPNPWSIMGQPYPYTCANICRHASAYPSHAHRFMPMPMPMLPTHAMPATSPDDFSHHIHLLYFVSCFIYHMFV